MKKGLFLIILVLLLIVTTGCQKDYYTEMKALYDNNKNGNYIELVQEYIETIPEGKISEFEFVEQLLNEHIDLTNRQIDLQEKKIELQIEFDQINSDYKFTLTNGPSNLIYLYQLADVNKTYVGISEVLAERVVIDPLTIDAMKHSIGITDGSSIPPGTSFYGYFDHFQTVEMIVGNQIENWKYMYASKLFNSIDEGKKYESDLFAQVELKENLINEQYIEIYKITEKLKKNGEAFESYFASKENNYSKNNLETNSVDGDVEDNLTITSKPNENEKTTEINVPEVLTKVDYIGNYDMAINALGRVLNSNNPKEINIAGMELYDIGKFDYAATIFYQGTILESTSNDTNYIALCNYNLACSLALLYSNGDLNSIDPIIFHLENSFRLKEDRILRSMKDTDFDIIRNSDEYIDLLAKYGIASDNNSKSALKFSDYFSNRKMVKLFDGVVLCQ